MAAKKPDVVADVVEDNTDAPVAEAPKVYAEDSITLDDGTVVTTYGDLKA